MATSSQISQVMYRIATVLCALAYPFANRETVAQTATEHPYIDPGKIKSETCLTCHPDKNEGRFVHATGAAGCESCHRSISEKRKTTISLAAEGGGLCTGCHQVKQSVVAHFPYKTGQCLVCHNPHSSAFPGQTRAAARTLCMSCHGEGSPDVKVDVSTKTVSLLGGRGIEFATYQRAQKVPSGHGEKSRSQSPSNSSAAEVNCLTCHNAHTSGAKGPLSLAGSGREAAGERKYMGGRP
jgi:predicted CXXCH cytochrome family protein